MIISKLLMKLCTMLLVFLIAVGFFVGVFCFLIWGGGGGGIDGIQAEHQIHGNCDELGSHLAAIYEAMFGHAVTLDISSMGIIIHILKKPALNNNKPDNYRPITLSSFHIELIEILMIPSDKSCNSQYGFGLGKGTPVACSLINDLMLYLNARGSPMFICSLDAEKCFDSIWYDSLFPKLASSDLSMRVGSSTFSNVAYADDVTLLSLYRPDLQLFIDLCESYGKKCVFTLVLI